MIDPEIAKNAADFRSGLGASLAANISAVLSKDASKIDECYARLTCLQAIRVYLLNNAASPGAIGFFNEAQSDGLTGLVLIMSGSSRSAHKSLRSLIENVIRVVYYADHPIEYRLWEVGKHRPTFRSLFEYIENHPDLVDVKSSLFLPSSLHSSWKKLSEFVHASAMGERMNENIDKIVIWKTSRKSIGQWAIFQRNVIKDICLLFMILNHKNVQGASLKSLRESLAISIPSNLDAKILSTFNVRLPRP